MKPILLVGEAKGANEVKINSSFVGASGIELLRMLHESGVITMTNADYDYITRFWQTGDPLCIDAIWQLHPEVHRTNVFDLHPPANDMAHLYGPKADGIPGYPIHTGGKTKKKGYIRKDFLPELDRLGDEILAIDPNLIIGFGNTPVWALCGKTGVSKLRGTTILTTHIVDGYKIIPTYHPAAILSQWDNRPIVVVDLMKAAREKDFPDLRRPKREVHIPEIVEDIDDFFKHYLPTSRILAVDIETVGNRITCIGFAPTPGLVLVVPFDDSRKKNRSFWSTQVLEVAAWKPIRRVLENPSVRKTFQNGLYDIAFTWRSMGIRVLGAEEDTMLLHHALQPESLKSLAFLGSIYTDEGPWKTERKGTQTIKRDE